MIETGFVSKVKIQDVISNQLPNFIRDESDETVDFLKQYYISQEYQGGSVDIVDNLEKYLNVNNLVPEVIVDNSTTVGLTTVGDEIVTVTSTKGFPNQYGLLKIDDEIITYTGITTNTFIGCQRGFSGITSYHSDTNKEDLVFSSSSASEHEDSSIVQNLSSLFLKEFYKKFKKTFLPGLEETDFQSNLDVGTFISEAKSLYQTKGSEESFRILFNILYGVTPRVLNLEDRLVKPSFAKYLRRRVCVAELLSGNPIQLKGQSLLKGLTGQTLFRSDLDDNINASISEIEPFERVNSGLTGITTYYRIGLFVGYDETADVENDFIVVPNTKCLEKVEPGSNIISVDSTVGFGTTGTIISGSNTITYTDKTVNQFLNCTGIGNTINPIENIRSNITYFGFENGDLDKKVSLRLTGVMSDFEQDSKVDVEEGDIISVLGLGDKVEDNNSSFKEIFCNSWIYNTSSSYFIGSINGSTYTLLSKINDSSLKKGDYVELVDIRDNTVAIPNSNLPGAPYVESVSDAADTVTLGGNTGIGAVKLLENGIINNLSDIVNFKLRKKLNKASSSGVPIKYGNDNVISDVQNVYIEKGSENAYVTSNSLPSYINNIFTERSKEIDINVSISTADLSLDSTLTGSADDQTDFSIINFAEPVGFSTGDKVFYSYSNGDGLIGIETGSYFVDVKGSEQKQIQLYTAPTNIDGGKNLTFSKSTSNGIIEFVLFSQRSSILSPQKLIKKFPLSQNTSNGSNELTPTGQIGMLINGVEISGYKSPDKVFFGPLTDVEILNSGDNYDVINLPNITVSAGIGTTALVQPVVKGKVKEVFVDPQDFDVSEVISVEVVGGNGSGCVLEPVVEQRFRSVFFNTRYTSPGGGISTSLNRITFNNDHEFDTGEPIIYDSNGNKEIGIGVTTDSLVNNSIYYPKRISSNTIELYDTPELTNIISFNGRYVSGDHFFKVGLRNSIVDIKVIEEGDGYTNRKLRVNSNIGINTSSNLITFKDHGFGDGDVIEYSSSNTKISGLTTSTGITTTTVQYKILKVDDDSFRVADAGIAGTITENYERRKFVDFSTTGTGQQIFSYPDIRANIEFSVSIGSTTQFIPKQISLTPKVRGSIEQIYLYESGTGYGSLIINNHKKPIVTLKNGKNASLRPIIVNGKIDSVSIESKGSEYFSPPDLEVIDSTGVGLGAKLRPVMSTDNKILDVIIVNAGIGYSTDSTIKVKSAGEDAFFEANVRSLTVNKHSNNNEYQVVEESQSDLKYSVTGYSTSLFGTSGLIGWAYDGNPIYGPFGSNDPEKIVNFNTKLISGYTENIANIEDRPSESIFPSGFFIEDYKFDGSGDLDEHNGRFENTPEFPNGVYAYHATIGNNNIPTFPYFIGNSFRSKKIDDNFSLTNQNNFNFNSDDILRNTFPYKVSDRFASNDFIVETSDIRDQKIEIEAVTSGSITGFNIIEGGSNYKVNEFLNFDETNTSGSGLISLVSKLDGKRIEKVETAVSKNESTVITWAEGQLSFFTPINHGLKNDDIVSISGISTDLSSLNDSFKIKAVDFDTTIISSITSSTGITTEIFVADIPESISIGSSITIGSETLKILKIYRDLNVLKVNRLSNLSTHNRGSLVNYLTNKFTVNKSISKFESTLNEKVFFNANESVGLGTTTGTELTRTFLFAGKNITRNIPVKQIYIENHPFKLNQRIKFTKPAGTNIVISDDNGANSFDIPETLFVVPKSVNTIGIKTQLSKVNETPEDEITFLSLTNGDNDNFLFESQLNEVTCDVEKIETEVVTFNEHQLETGDKISLVVEPGLSVGIGTSSNIRISRDSLTGSILVNPIVFTSEGVSTSTNSINLKNHNLQTGDKIKYESNLLPEGLENKNYFVYKVDDDNLKLCETLIDSQKDIPNITGIGSTGGSSQSISLINSKIKAIKNNDLVFDLADSSLQGYEFKLYHDNSFLNEFISVSDVSNTFNVSVSGPLGFAGTSLTIGYTTSLPNILYYNLEKSGVIGTVDTDVKNYSQILFEESGYNNNYSITKVGINTFKVFLDNIPEKLSYTSIECDSLKYSTDSKTATGAINSIKIISGGSNYKKIPQFIGVGGTSIGVGAVLQPTSQSVGKVEKIRVINEGFEYSSDKTLQPESLMAKSVDITNTDSLGIVSVTSGGSNYITPPNIEIINSSTGKKINSGFLEPVMLENSILAVNIVETPVGLPARPVTLRATNNTNGIVITDVISNNTGIFTCKISTPPGGFDANNLPFASNDRVFIEGIQKVGTAGSGFNSSDYGFNLLKVDKYENLQPQAKVTIDVSEFGTSATGTAVGVLTNFATVINQSDYPEFFVIQNQSNFQLGETIIVNNVKTNLEITSSEPAKLKIFGDSELNVGDKIKGFITGSECEVQKVSKNTARLKTNFSVLKDLGWEDDIGKLNDDFQLLPDNDYYQNMSYSIQSPIEWDNLKTSVNNLVHTSGMKNFADVGVSSSTNSGLSTDSDNEITIIRDLFSNKRVDEIKNIDTVRDINITGNTSRFIKFDNLNLSDFIRCKTNDVLVIDDISSEFSNLQGQPNQFIDLFQFPDSDAELYNNLTIIVRNDQEDKLEIKDLIILSNGSENILVEKSNLINSGQLLNNIEEDNIVNMDLHRDPLTDIDTLRFSPKVIPDAGNDVDYDLKIFKTEFNSSSIGVGSTSIGPIKLTSKIQNCAVGVTTNIISVPVDNFDSLYATMFVLDTVTKEMNLVESFVSHKDSDTFLTESYFNGERNDLSLNKLGIITSSISSGNLILSFENTQITNLKLKSKIIGIGTVGVANGIFRFKSTGQEDGNERFSLYAGVSTSNAGISTIESLNSNLFDAVKSVVEVSIGSSKSIHEVLFLHDGTDAYSQQSGSLSLTKDSNTEYDSSSGLGTFSANLSGSNFVLQFHPDNTVGVSTVVSLNHCFYKKVDLENTAEDLDYGVIKESSSFRLYNSITGNRVKRTRFTPKVNNIPIFGKTFNPSNTTQLNASTGLFTIENHFFRNNEELIYKPNTTFVGVGSTPMQYKGVSGGIGSLTSPVYAVFNDSNSFFISTTKSGTAVTFTSLGEGNSHEFNMAKSNEKSLFIIDDVAQYPLIRTDVTHTLDGNLSSEVGITTNIIHLSGISTLSSSDILKIDDEFVEIVNVGFATTGGGAVGASGTFNTVQVNRSFVGSSATTHSDGTTVTRFKGSYHISGRDLVFTRPPRGDLSRSKDINDLPIPTSKFSGRVYLRNNYDANVIFDDVSDQFTGIKSDFILKVGGANTVGLGTTGGSGILFINGVFQSPSTEFNPGKNFKILESGSGATGLSTVLFTGITSANGQSIISNNINLNELPRGGVPISIGNTVNGLGYAPLVGANVKALFNSSGEITSVVGTAYSASDLTVIDADYNEVTGIMTVTTLREHPFNNRNDFVLLSGIGFNPALSIRDNSIEVISIASTNVFRVSIGKSTTSHTYTSGGSAYPSYPSLTFGSGYNSQVSIGVTVVDPGYEHRFISADPNSISGSLTPTDASYDPVTGILRLTVPSHGLNNSSTITIATGGISFSCSKDNFKTVHAYPRSTDYAAGQNLNVTKITDDIFSVYVEPNVGSGAQITATAGVGGTTIFSIVSAGTSYKDPQIFVSEPSYSNLSVRGISRLGIGETTDTGNDLKVNAIVTPNGSATGIGSTLFQVSEYEIVNFGFGYKKGDVVEAVGLVTTKELNQLESTSRLTIDKVYSDSFALWQFGSFDYVDSIKSLQDGSTSSFQLKVNGQLVSVELDKNTMNVNSSLENVFLVTVNGIIQEPKKAYTIFGGNIINFKEIPIPEDDISILFYKGTPGEDSLINLKEKIIIEEGDNVQIKSGGGVPEQEERTVYSLNTSQTLETNPYVGVGIRSDIGRSLSLIKQKEDKIINKVIVSKKRSSLEPRIGPVAKVISDISASQSNNEFYVDNASIFNYEDLSSPNGPALSLQLIDFDNTNLVKAKATALVSAAGTITGFTINNAGAGYTTEPTVKLLRPPVAIKNTFIDPQTGITSTVGIGTTATATALINAAGIVTAINLTNPGFGYTSTAAPQVLISSPVELPNISEEISTLTGASLTVIENKGDITGIGTTIFGGKLAIKFSVKRHGSVGFGVDSPIEVGKPIYIFDTQVGSGVTSISNSGNDSHVIGIGTTFVDNIYVVAAVGDGPSSGTGIITSLVKSDTAVSNLSLTGSSSQPIGKYSVGLITGFTRGSNPISIGVTGLTVGLSTALGISTFPTLRRTGGPKTFEQSGALMPEPIT